MMFQRFSSLYVLGLTGSIASGKSARCNRVNELAGEAVRDRFGLPIHQPGLVEGLKRTVSGSKYISADLIGHQSYLPGSECYHNVVKAFGEGILDTSDSFSQEQWKPIDRKKLGPIVFSDSEKMKLLNSIVWPSIRGLLQDRIAEEAAIADKHEERLQVEHSPAMAQSATSSGCRLSRSILVIEAALLLEMGLTDICDEVWLITVEKDEAVKRIMHRDAVDEELAKKKLSSQMDSHERVEKVQQAAQERLAGQSPLHVEVLDTTGAVLKDDLETTIPLHFFGLLRRMLE